MAECMQNHAENRAVTKRRTWRMHVECVRSEHKSRNVDAVRETKKRKKVETMSSKEVFEMVYGPRMGISLIEDE